MFVDFCFPNNNEEDFLNVAKKLSIEAICFVYDNQIKIKKIVDEKIKIYSGLLIKNPLDMKQYNVDFIFCAFNANNLSKNKETIYFFDEKRSCAISNITQVVIKELASESKKLVISFNLILTNRSNAKIIERLFFIIKLCKKYGVPVFITSFANSPYELRSKKELFDVSAFFGLKEKFLKKCPE